MVEEIAALIGDIYESAHDAERFRAVIERVLDTIGVASRWGTSDRRQLLSNRFNRWNALPGRVSQRSRSSTIICPTSTGSILPSSLPYGTRVAEFF